MSSDDEFDDLFSFSSPAKTEAPNANAVDSDATNKATSDDDFLDDMFGTENATTAAVTDTDDSFLDVFDSPPLPDSNRAAKAAGTVAMDDIEAEFDLLTADASVAPASANTAEVATIAAAASPATSMHVDSAQTTVVDRSNMAAQGKSRGDLTAAASAASGGAANDASVPSTLEPAADKIPLVASAEEVNMNMNEEFPSIGEKLAVSLTDTVPSMDATVSKESVLSKSNNTSSASSLKHAPTPEEKAPPTTTSSDATLLHDDVHTHDADTQEMLNFLEDSDNTEAEQVGSVVPSLTVDHSPSSDALHTNSSIPTNYAPSVKDNNANKGKDYVGDENDDDDDFGAFASVESATSPMALSPTEEAAGGISRTRQRLQSEDLNQTEDDGAFNFEKDILGVTPTEGEMPGEKAKQGKEKKAESQTATEEAAADKTLRNTTDTANAKNEGSDTAKRTSLPRAAIMTGNTSSVRQPNLTIPSKLSIPLRRKDRAQGGMEGPAPPSSECESTSSTRGMVDTGKEEGGSTRMGSILNSIKAKAAASTGGSESNNTESTVATGAKEVSDRTGAAAAAVAATSNPKTLSPPKISAPPKFETLAEAVRSTKSTPSLIADLFKDEQEKTMRAAGWTIADTDRAYLWVKLFTGKTMGDVASGSLVDGFTAWDESFNLVTLDDLLSSKNDAEIMNDPAPSHDVLQLDLHSGILDLSLLRKVRCESKQLARDINRMRFEGRDSFERNLCSIVLFHHRSMAQYAATAEKGSSEDQWTTKKTTLAGVVAVLLAAPLPPPVASVVLTRLFSSTLPLMGLDDTPFPPEDEVDMSDQEAIIKPKGPHQSERNSAICALHSKLYCLATYHLPLLVTHLDRHCPSWWMPASKPPDITDPNNVGGSVDAREEMHPTTDTSTGKSSDSVLEFKASGRHHCHKGYIPTSWFVTHCVGIPGIENLDLYQSVLLWDSFLASGDSSFIFFLALAILEASSDELLMLQGKELGCQLYNLLTFCVKNENTSQDGGQGDESFNANATEMKVKKWIEMSMLLEQSTPKSVVKDLSSAEVAVVGTALTRRRELAEASQKAKVLAEAREKRKQRQDDAKRALLKTRLTQYYRRQAPDKVDSVDRILEVYEGRYDVLDSNLRRKYGGAGFLPTICVNPQLSTSTSKLLSSMKDQKAKIAQKMESAAQRQKNRGDGDQKKPDDSYHVSDIGVAVEVKASEVIPIICGRSTSKDLKFILVDCRPEMSQNEGRFATSVSASSLTDVDKLETLEALFEKLRGAVHIVVMGEGFSAFPQLYHHQLSRNESHLAREDHARTQNCAHFFIKRGYPFVSILDGGFAAAHAYISRHSTDSDPDSDPLTPSSVLVNHDPRESKLAKLEWTKNASKADRIQDFLDNSMTVLTKSEEAIEKGYMNATSALSTKFSLGGSGKDGLALVACTEENGEADESDGKACSTDLVDEKKDENDEMERSTRTNVAAAMKIRFSSFSSSVNATHVGGGSSSADGDSNETAPSTSLKRISDALGQAKKSAPAPSSLKMSLGVAKAPFPQSSSSLKISKLKSKISSKIQISSNRQAAAAAAKNTNDIEQESITFHEEE